MTVEIKTNEVKNLPCLMKNNMGQIVLATKYDDLKFVTVLANTDGSKCDVGKTWETKLLPTEYFPLPSGYQVTITN